MLVLVALLCAAGCGGGGGGPKTASGVDAYPSGTPSEVKDAADEWSAPNADLANTRDASGSSIDSGNVSKLGVAWTAPITAKGVFGGYATTPVVANGVVYTQDLDSNVFAYDLKTGKQLWTHAYNDTDEGPNGVAIGYGKVFGATSRFAFALDLSTGDEVWRSKQLTRNAQEGIDIQPGVFDNTVYVSTVPGNAKGFYKGNGIGVIYALDASSGDEQWHFDTVPRDLWDSSHTDINSGGGLWFTPAFDADGNMYADVANPAPWPGTNKYPWGASRPGADLYTNSALQLDHSSGKLHLPPVLANVDGKDVVVVGGKMGYVYELDRSDGTLLWKKSVGQHNGHDTDNETVLEGDTSSLKTPKTVLPGALGGVETQMAVDGSTVYAAVVNIPAIYQTQEKLSLDFTKASCDFIALNLSDGSVKWEHKLQQPAYGAATLSNDLVFTTTFDGKVLALDKDTGKTVWTHQLPAGTNATVAIAGDTLITAASVPSKTAPAQIVALRIGAEGTESTTSASSTTTTGGAASANGKAIFSSNCASCHTLAAAGASGSVGPNLDQLQPSFSTVKTQVINGGGVMPSFKDTLSPAQIDTVAHYVADNANPNATSGGGGGGKGP